MSNKSSISDSNRASRQSIDRERREILQQIEEWLEIPMLVLSFVWTVLLIVEFVWGLSSLLNAVSTTIWITFIVDFMFQLLLAPQKLNYLKHNWLTAFALLLPAVRIFRVTRIIRVLGTAPGVQGVQLLRVLVRINRGMKTLSKSFSRRGFGYVVALTLLVVFTGAAGMYVFERNIPGSTLTNYGNALWWTAMVKTETMMTVKSPARNPLKHSKPKLPHCGNRSKPVHKVECYLQSLRVEKCTGGADRIPLANSRNS